MSSKQLAIVLLCIVLVALVAMPTNVIATEMKSNLSSQNQVMEKPMGGSFSARSETDTGSSVPLSQPSGVSEPLGAADSGWIPDIPVVSTSDAQQRPSMTRDGAGNLYVAFEEWSSTYSHYMNRIYNSVNGGVTWSPYGYAYSSSYDLLYPSIAATTTPGDIMVAFEAANGAGGIGVWNIIGGTFNSAWVTTSGGDHRPSLTFDEFSTSNAYAYLTYEYDAGIIGGWDISFAISTSTPFVTWSSPTSIVGGGLLDTSINRNPSISYGSGGYLYVSYERGASGSRDIYVMRSTDLGSTWSSDPGYMVSSSSYDEYDSRIAASHSGNYVVVTFTSVYSGSDNNIGYAYSTSSGSSWLLGYLAVSTASEGGSNVAADWSGGYFRATYREASNILRYTEAPYNSPSSWSTTVNVIDSSGFASSSYVRTAVSSYYAGGSNYPAVAWTDLRNPSYDIYYTTRIQSISVDPPTASVVVGGTQGFSGTAYIGGGFAVSGVSFSWSVTGGIGTVSPTTGTSTTFTATTAGTGTVVATSGSVTGSASVTVIPQFDFSISVSPISGSVVQGGSVPSTVTVTLVSGTTQSVSLSASGLPSGATASFNPSSGNPTFTSTMTISASSTTPTGTYPVTITGTGGGKSHPTTYTLTVTQPPFDFMVSVDPTSGSVQQGGNVQATVTVTLTSGATQSVSLSASGLPSGATAGFNPSSGNPTFTSTMTISTSASTPTGTYPVTITGTGGGKSHSATYTLTVTQPPFDFTVSVYPTGSSVIQGGSVQAAVTVNLTSGATQSVSCSASGLPSGANATFNPSSGNPTFTSTMTISTSVSTPAGTYPVTITCTGGGKSHSATYTLTVMPQYFDFAVSVSPASGSVVQGGSVQATVTVNLTSGATQYVSCSASGQPSGVTVNFNPSSGLPTFTSAMTISTSSTTPKGTYTITIACEGGGNLHPAMYALTVISPGFDFTVSVNPTSGSVQPGGNVQATVTVTLASGATQSVSLSASGLPSGANATFNPSSGNPTFTSIMTISTSSTTPTGTYTITITGTGGTKTATYILTVTTTPPGTINVNTNLASATFALTGAATYSGSGTSWSQSNAPIGDYTITYGDVSGYITPSSEKKTLTAGGSITFTGTYTQSATAHKIGGYVYKTGTSQGIAGATITANPGGYSATTDSAGHYSLSVADGTYTISVSASGYQSTSASVTVSGADVNQDFNLIQTGGGGNGVGGIDNIMLLMLILMVVMIAVVIITLIMRKKKKQDPPPTPAPEEKTTKQPPDQ